MKLLQPTRHKAPRWPLSSTYSPSLVVSKAAYKLDLPPRMEKRCQIIRYFIKVGLNVGLPESFFRIFKIPVVTDLHPGWPVNPRCQWEVALNNSITAVMPDTMRAKQAPDTLTLAPLAPREVGEYDENHGEEGRAQFPDLFKAALFGS